MIEEIIESVGKNGGCIIHPITLSQPTKGYVVSLDGYGMITTIGKDVLSQLREGVPAYLTRLKELGCMTLHDTYLEVWVNEDIIYYDLSIIILDKQTAIMKGLKEKQQCIYDLNYKGSIWV